jgi:hypothetical protein
MGTNMAWRAAALLFTGGTEEAKRLTGKKVRALARLMTNEFMGRSEPPGGVVSIAPGTVGFVGYPYDDWIVIGFPKAGRPLPASLAQLSSGRSFSIRCNWATFRQQFELES